MHMRVTFPVPHGISKKKELCRQENGLWNLLNDVEIQGIELRKEWVMKEILSCLNVDTMRGSARLKIAQWNGVASSLMEDAIISITSAWVSPPVHSSSPSIKIAFAFALFPCFSSSWSGSTISSDLNWEDNLLSTIVLSLRILCSTVAR